MAAPEQCATGRLGGRLVGASSCIACRPLDDSSQMLLLVWRRAAPELGLGGAGGRLTDVCSARRQFVGARHLFRGGCASSTRRRRRLCAGNENEAAAANANAKAKKRTAAAGR